MSNEVEDKTKNCTYYFSVILSIWKILIQVILKQMKSDTNVFVFTTLDM